VDKNTMHPQWHLFEEKLERVIEILERLETQALATIAEVEHTSAADHKIDRGKIDRYQSFAREVDRVLHGDLHAIGSEDGHDRSLLVHHDVLVDGNGMELEQHLQHTDLSPQVQVQRLTAQLTAAYSRIAALEEQLLAKRWH
jgi:hypothetical protein